MKRKVDESESSISKIPKCSGQCETFERVAKDICQELEQTTSDRDELKQKLDIATAKLSKIEPKRVHQKLKRKDNIIANKKSSIVELKKQIKHSKATSPITLEKLKIKNESLYEEVKELRHQKANAISYYRSKLLQKRAVFYKRCQETINSQKTLIQSLMDKNEYLENQCASLSCHVQDSSPHLVKSKANGREYDHRLRSVVSKLITYNVAIRNIGSVLKSVLHLADVDLTSIPDETTCRRIAREMNVVANQQLSEVLSEETNTTAKWDGTTKGKQHWGEAQISTPDCTYTIGVTKMAGGTAEHYSSLITSKINDCGTRNYPNI